MGCKLKIQRKKAELWDVNSEIAGGSELGENSLQIALYFLDAK